MSYIKNIKFNLIQENPYPFNVPSIKYAKNIEITKPICFFIGENGTGKSTLIEALAYRLQLPHIDGSDYLKPSFASARQLMAFLKLEYKINLPIGFFFRAEDFGDYINSVHRNDISLEKRMGISEDEVPVDILKEMRDNANFQKYHMRKNYGQELETMSHGEAYLKIIHEKISNKGIFILDEPEAALSPSRQLSLIYYILEHLKKHNSQFIIATHSPILMSIPNSQIFEITEESMNETELESTSHYSITRSFLNHPELFLRNLID